MSDRKTLKKTLQCCSTNGIIFMDIKQYMNIKDLLKNYTGSKANIDNIYCLEGRVPLAKAFPFGFQHVMAMLAANIVPIILVAGAAGLSPELKAVLIQNCMVIAGIGTLVQLYPLWKVGSSLPIVMGTSFTCVAINAL